MNENGRRSNTSVRKPPTVDSLSSTNENSLTWNLNVVYNMIKTWEKSTESETRYSTAVNTVATRSNLTVDS